MVNDQQDGVLDGASKAAQWGNAVLSYLIYGFLIAPSLIVIPMSFGGATISQFPPSEFSLDLYRIYFSDESWIAATRQSILVAVSSTALALLIGVPAAYVIERSGARLISAFNLAILSPAFIPSIVLALGLYLYFSSLGLIGTTVGIIIAHTLVVTPFVVITAVSGLKQIDGNLERAGRILGAGAWTVFWKVTLPLMKPALAAGALIGFLISLDEVVITSFIGNNATATLPVKMFSSIRWEISPVIAVVSTLLTVVSMVGCIFIARLQERSRTKG